MTKRTLFFSFVFSKIFICLSTFAVIESAEKMSFKKQGNPSCNGSFHRMDQDDHVASFPCFILVYIGRSVCNVCAVSNCLRPTFVVIFSWEPANCAIRVVHRDRSVYLLCR